MLDTVPFIRKFNEFEFLIVHQTSGHWAFPKGQKKEGETHECAARRELLEETGIQDCNLLPGFEYVMKYSYLENQVTKNKSVTFYLGEIFERKMDITNPDEVQEIIFLNYSKAMERLTYEESKEMLKGVKRCLDNKGITK